MLPSFHFKNGFPKMNTQCIKKRKGKNYFQSLKDMRQSVPIISGRVGWNYTVNLFFQGELGFSRGHGEEQTKYYKTLNSR